MLLADGALGLALLALWIFCLIDVIVTDGILVRNLPKGAWLLIVLVLPDVGSIVWLVAGRPWPSSSGQQRPAYAPGFPEHQRERWAPRRSGAPDDDPEFLQQLRRSNDQHEQMLGQWEADLRRREEELRRRDGEDPERPA